MGLDDPSFPGGGNLYSKRTIDEVKKSVDIVDFIGRYLNLEKSGSYFRGLCPFHSDNDPSFYVHPARGFFHCFGCGESGDVIAFLQKAEEVSFNDALKKLADFAGVVTESQTESQSLYERYVRLLACAADYYHSLVSHADCEEAKSYLTKERGLSQQTIALFKIGFALPSKRGLNDYLTGKGFRNSDLESAGLISGKGAQVKERFAGRLIFPIDNESGRTVALGARAFGDEIVPKYLNSPETKYFRKGRTLYNLSRAKTAATQLDFMVVVEGYFDVLGLHEVGVQNVVGVLGTAMTDAHVRMISGITNNLILFLDSDPAGLRACRRSIELAEKHGLQVAVATSDEKDPSDLLKRKGSAMVREALENAVPAPVFLVELLGRSLDLTNPEGKQKLFEHAKPIMQTYRSSGKIGSFQLVVSTLADLTGISEDMIFSTLKDPQRIRSRLRSTRSPLRPLERELIMVYLRFPDLRDRLLRILDLFESSEAFKKLENTMRAGSELEEVIRACDAQMGSEIMNLAAVPLDPTIAESILGEIEERVDKKIISEQIRTIDRKLQAQIDTGTKNSLMTRRIELSRLLKRVRKDGESVGKKQI